jgi:2-oxoglutarate ferredoxin oxidoreductase subunit gamma
VVKPKILVAMSQDGYMTHKNNIPDDGIIIYEKDLVTPEKHGPNVKSYGIPATRFAEELGRKIVFNIVVLGLFGAVTKIMPREALAKAVDTSVPAGTQELNLKAFNKGYDYGLELLGKA